MSLLNRTYLYLKKNGIKQTYYTCKERLEQKMTFSYNFVPVTAEELEKQRKWYQDKQEQMQSIKGTSKLPLISIVVPLYCTKPEYFEEMVASVLNQSYGNWELVLVDASPKDRKLGAVLERISTDPRIKYATLEDNKGISENTNAAIELATGDYIGLLDHDDVLTPDALFEVTQVISRVYAGEENDKSGNCNGAIGNANGPILVYSDEDKSDEKLEHFYEPNIKPDFDLDLLLSNNYICHFSVIRADVLKSLGLRNKYDGAQDYDLMLRIAGLEDFSNIYHIPKVLYHWRCFSGSTSENPMSKLYAYDAGKEALKAYFEKRGLEVNVEHSEHLGFYKTIYKKDILKQRKELAAVGGPIYNHRQRICAGGYDNSGKIIYENLPVQYSGYLNRAKQKQNIFLDIRNMRLADSEEVRKCARQVLGEDIDFDEAGNILLKDKFINRLSDAKLQLSIKDVYGETNEESNMDVSNREMLYRALSVRLGKSLLEQGYLSCYDPEAYLIENGKRDA